MPDVLDYLDDRFIDLVECIDKQVELTNKMAPLLVELQRLAVKLQDQAEELMLIVADEKKVAAV